MWLARKRNKDIRIYDWMVFLTILFMLATRFFTIFLVFDISEETGVEIEKVVKVYESNPIAVWVLNLHKIGYVLTTLVAPAFIIALYYTFRRAVIKGKFSVEYLGYYVTVFFVMMLINVINDAAYYLARVI